jgi:hypothetical protein
MSNPAGKTNAKSGTTQRPRQPTPLFERVSLVCGDGEPTYYWDHQGNLFHDEDLTQSAGLIIVRPRFGGDE